jgi:hypothetical protein
MDRGDKAEEMAVAGPRQGVFHVEQPKAGVEPAGIDSIGGWVGEARSGVAWHLQRFTPCAMLTRVENGSIVGRST